MFDLSDGAAIRSNAGRAVWRAEKQGRIVVVKTWLGDADAAFPPVLAHRAMNAIRAHVTEVAIPEHLADGYVEGLGHYVVMTHLEGTAYPWDWSSPQRGGGRALTLAHGREAIIALKALQSAAPAVQAVGLPTVSRANVYADMRKTIERLCADALISDEIGAEALQLLHGWSEEPVRTLGLSNSDFRFANMLRQAGSGPVEVGVVDWDDARLSDFECAHAIAHCWIFLWNNPGLQDFLIQQSERTFGLELPALRPMILYRAARQLYMSRDLPERRQIHARQIEMALDLI